MSVVAAMAASPSCWGQVNWDKQHKLFFAGGVRFDDVSYSHGVRQTLMLLFKDTPGTLFWKNWHLSSRLAFKHLGRLPDKFSHTSTAIQPIAKSKIKGEGVSASCQVLS